MTAPRRAAPIATRISPAISVATCSPAIPCWAVITASTATKAPVGPEICSRVPPKSDVHRPATIAVYRPCSGRAPEAIAKAIASGIATTPTIVPASKFPSRWRGVSSPLRRASRMAITPARSYRRGPGSWYPTGNREFEVADRRAPADALNWAPNAALSAAERGFP